MYTFSAASSLYFHLSEKQATCFGWSVISLTKDPMFLNEIIYYYYYLCGNVISFYNYKITPLFYINHSNLF